MKLCLKYYWFVFSGHVVYTFILSLVYVLLVLALAVHGLGEETSDHVYYIPRCFRGCILSSVKGKCDLLLRQFPT